MSATTHFGKPVSRVDGRAKVTGEAKYAAEFTAPDLTYGVVVSSAITKGRISSIDATEALAVPGVLEVFTHENAPRAAWLDRSYKDEDSPPGVKFKPLSSEKIQFAGQPIALVVADSFETARYAATLVKVLYQRENHQTDLEFALDQAYEPPKVKSGSERPASRGKTGDKFKEAKFKIEEEYVHSTEHHNPMEMHATTVIVEDDGTFKIHDKTQGPMNTMTYVKNVFGLSKDEIHVVSPYVGGAFGSGLRPQYQLFLAMMAAQSLKRSVRVVLTRQQMFTFGHRPETIQKLALGADENGKLLAIEHEAIAETSQTEDYTENVVNWSGVAYQCDDVKLAYKLVKLDRYTPLDMRAPGAATGMPALESAIDELAYKAKIDPLEFRLINYAEKDQAHKKAFSSKELRACYKQGADIFGWKDRPIEPRSMKRGNKLVGWGMATGMWEAFQQKAAAKAKLSSDGRLQVASATADIGTGTYTIMTQIAAETLGLPIEKVTFCLGDSSLPEAPLQGGSWTASSVGTAVQIVCQDIGKEILKLASKHDEFKKVKFDEVRFSEGHIVLKADPSKALSIIDLMHESGTHMIEKNGAATPNFIKQMPYTRSTHSAVFVEVEVDQDFGTIEVKRVVSAIAGGKIINPKTARSQILGGVVWGIGMALHEETFMDHNFGRYINHDFAEYHVPVNKDIHDIEVIFVKEEDEIVNPLGVKGLGEIGIVGVAGAIANAVFHATGKRVRDFPITLDKVLGH